MFCEILQPAPHAATAAYPGLRSLHHCLSDIADLLYDNGHVLEIITLPHRGLAKHELAQLNEYNVNWKACQQILEESGAAVFNNYERWVLTATGRELMFDMFGQGAADCA